MQSQPRPFPWLTAVGVLAGVLCVLALIAALLLLATPADAPSDKPTRAALKADDNERLASYGWIDKQAGAVHIPADRAAELLLKERGGQ